MLKSAMLAAALLLSYSATTGMHETKAQAVAAPPQGNPVHATYYAQYLNGTCYIHQWEANGTHNILTNWLCAPVSECYEIAFWQNANASGTPVYY